MALLELVDVHAAYGASQVLHGVTLEVERGQHVGIIGRNGMGKSTLLHTIMGFLRPTAGTISFAGEGIAGTPSEAIAAKGIAIVPQGRRVFGSLSIGENLIVSHRPSRASDGWTIDDVCDRFPLLRDRWNQSAGTLSGGQQQILAVARALVGNADLVLLDEPSEGLDQHHLAMVTDTIAELRSRGTAAILVEQKLHLAAELTEVLHVMVRGRLTQTFTAEAVRADAGVALRGLGFEAAAPGARPSQPQESGGGVS